MIPEPTGRSTCPETVNQTITELVRDPTFSEVFGYILIIALLIVIPIAVWRTLKLIDVRNFSYLDSEDGHELVTYLREINHKIDQIAKET